MVFNKIKTIIFNCIKLLFRLFIHLIYYLSGFFPRSENVWVFGSGGGKRFGDNPKWFFYYCNWRKNNLDFTGSRFIWISRDKEVVQHIINMNYEAFYLYSIKGIYYCLRAKVYVFDNNPVDISYVLSRKAIKVNLWHGSPLKKIIWDALDNTLGKNRSYLKKDSSSLLKLFYRFLHPLYFYKIDLLTASSQYVKKCFCSAFYVAKDNVCITGYPRNDVFFDLEYIRNSLENEIQYKYILKLKEVNRYKKIIIYMPTFRDTKLKSDNLTVDDLFLLDRFMISNNCLLICKYHFITKKKNKNKLGLKNIIFLDPEEDPYPILKISDILITDYSSVFFDYLLMDKPIIFYPYDFDTYVRNDRELYVDNYDDETPGPKAYNLNELMDLIKVYIYTKDLINIEKYTAIKKKYNDMFDGNYSKKVYEHIISMLTK